jgi:repressor LexA
MLTHKQQELLLFIHHRVGDGGVSPSFDEMKDALNLKSKSGIHRLVTSLEERGFIRRLPHRARALEILRLPDGIDGAGEGAARGDADMPVFPMSLPGRMATETAQIPLYGRIAAGIPIEAWRDGDAMLDIPVSMIGTGDYFALEVAGDSMIGAGILDGDLVIIRRCDNVENGAIVVALIEEGEVTLKRLRRKGRRIELEPANARYETRVFGPDEVRVQGRLVGLIRKY